jgi:hypothetical protein
METVNYSRIKFYDAGPGMSKIGFLPYPIPLKRTGWHFQTIMILFNLILLKNIPFSVKNG